jgi:hypothetical protein
VQETAMAIGKGRNRNTRTLIILMMLWKDKEERIGNKISKLQKSLQK